MMPTFIDIEKSTIKFLKIFLNVLLLKKKEHFYFLKKTECYLINDTRFNKYMTNNEIKLNMI